MRERGEQGIVLTCEHVRQDNLTATATIDRVVTATQSMGSFSNETVAVRVGYCDRCAQQHALPIRGGA